MQNLSSITNLIQFAIIVHCCRVVGRIKIFIFKTLWKTGYSIESTTWNRAKIFAPLKLPTSNVNFVNLR